MKTIRLVGEVNEEMYITLSEALEELEADEDAIEADIELVSEGGSAYDALAIAGRMRSSPLNVTIVACGKCMSAAVLILAAGDTRLATQGTWFMVHEDSGRAKGKTCDIERQASQMQAEERAWNAMLEDCTGTSEVVWDELAVNETYFGVGKARELNLITGTL